MCVTVGIFHYIYRLYNMKVTYWSKNLGIIQLCWFTQNCANPERGLLFLLVNKSVNQKKQKNPTKTIKLDKNKPIFHKHHCLIGAVLLWAHDHSFGFRHSKGNL